jgi:hypothetical protein
MSTVASSGLSKADSGNMARDSERLAEADRKKRDQIEAESVIWDTEKEHERVQEPAGFIRNRVDPITDLKVMRGPSQERVWRRRRSGVRQWTCSKGASCRLSWCTLYKDNACSWGAKVTRARQGAGHDGIDVGLGRGASGMQRCRSGLDNWIGLAVELQMCFWGKLS